MAKTLPYLNKISRTQTKVTSQPRCTNQHDDTNRPCSKNCYKTFFASYKEAEEEEEEKQSTKISKKLHDDDDDDDNDTDDEDLNTKKERKCGETFMNGNISLQTHPNFISIDENVKNANTINNQVGRAINNQKYFEKK